MSIAFVACQEKFDKIKWQTKEYPEAPPESRKRMLHDLTANYKLKGLRKTELTDLLGEPNYADDSTISYLVEEDYGTDIDPIYTKFLRFTLDRDSTIVGFKVDEWKK
jgi:hypothetical protein